MKLNNLLKNVDILNIIGDTDIEIKDITSNSKDVKDKTLFVAIRGEKFDGHDFVGEAIENGASCVILEKDVHIKKNVTKIITCNTRSALGIVSSNFYGNPSDKLKLVGITGTNGKTTITYLCRNVFQYVGFKTALLGTIKNIINEETIATNLTTVDPVQLQKHLNYAVSQGVDWVFMEVSSHGLAQERVKGTKFDICVFTNLTQEHLDYHKDMENYFQAKLKLFTEYGKNSFKSVINIDDEYGMRVIDILKRNKNEFITYGINRLADIQAKNVQLQPTGTKFEIIYQGKKINIELKLIGRFNVYNALATFGVGILGNLDIDKIRYALNNALPIRGRMEKVDIKKNFHVFVDYAHTPAGLKEILQSTREFCKGKIISVFGCGGDRDKTKRPVMGEIASLYSDFTIITSDNPRSEDPQKIVQEIEAGFLKNNSTNYEIIVDRYSAIKKALLMAQKDDVVLIAGKGHENYQIFKDKTIHFDDREVVNEIISKE